MRLGAEQFPAEGQIWVLHGFSPLLLLSVLVFGADHGILYTES